MKVKVSVDKKQLTENQCLQSSKSGSQRMSYRSEMSEVFFLVNMNITMKSITVKNLFDRNLVLDNS